MLESTIEKYFKASVRAHGGDTMKFVSPGRRNVPDQLVTWPARHPVHIAQLPPVTDFAEIKAPGKKPRPGQLREHARLRALGYTVVVIDSKESVDNYVRNK
ncbi:VRR-NUC domain containing protein [uncultured Caudovirales phage]|uniref:VRR-NUC domain containing protein n=1 Tax=uncultured Caudovirales phage TaxID=2100421 RepID=A0A6J5SF70_9CAUD|nr:VRR-NUC domain containing protein [uncultured Caudovirales phage]CAB4212679.1 VRR-NUC domain containing protein [uncultured Caudovirales phage]